MTVNILGAEYEIIVKKYNEDETFKRLSVDGYCNSYKKEIAVCDLSTYDGFEHEDKENHVLRKQHTLRHEIVHAFLNESGLMGSAGTINEAWPHNEEMVDWIAIQFPKMVKAMQAAECLPIIPAFAIGGIIKSEDVLKTFNSSYSEEILAPSHDKAVIP